MKKKLFFILALTAMAMSCSELNVVQEQLHEITAATFVNVATKAPVTGTTYPTSRTIMLSAYHSSVGTYMTGIPFNYYTPSGGSAGWHGGSSGAENLKYWPHSGTMNFIALSMGDLGGSPTYNASSISYPMPDNSSSQTDVMMAYAGSRDCAAHAAVPLNFKHALAQVAITASCGVNNTTTNHGVSIRNVYLCNAKYSGTVTGTASGTDGVTFDWASLGSAVGSKSFGASETRLSSSPSACGTSGIMVPGQGSSGTSIVIEYTLHNGKDAAGTSNTDVNLSYTYSIPSTTWAAGLIYTYAFTFTLNEITCSPSVTTWSDGAGASPSI